ncbi:MAG: hypothetical protein U0694_27980 [Anaerolineae bacterium]
MGLKSITLQLPEDVYSAVQEAARVRGSSVEAVIIECAAIIYGDLLLVDVDALMEQMSFYTDTQLWAVAYRHLTPTQSDSLEELTDKNKSGQLTASEETALDRLLDLIDRHMLLRSQALLLLKQRGRDIDTFLSRKV